MKETPIYIPAHDWDAVETLPQDWGSPPTGWRFAKRLLLQNSTDLPRRAEPVETDVDFHARHVTDLARELRLARVGDAGIEIVPAQIHPIGREDDILRTRLFFLADVAANGKATYLVLYGNPDAPEPEYETDLVVSGEGYALEVENAHYRAVMAKMNGNWKNHYSKRGPAELVNRHGHGVAGTIHWGPDWSDERVGRYRLTNWGGPPLFDYEVLRGPVCVRIRRWGHPVLSLGPQVGRPHKVMATVTYSFWAGQPYVIMESQLQVLEDVRFRDCRNDEFVIGEELPERAWMGPDGEIGFGPRGWQKEDPRRVTHFNRDTGEGFASIHLEFENTNPNCSAPDHAGFSHTGTWVRYPVTHAPMRAGDHVYERNAYVLHRYDEGADLKGLADLVAHRERLANPIAQGELAPIPRPIERDAVIDALRATNEFELYVKGSPWGQRQLSFVDIGVIRHIAIDGNDLRVDLVMPYAGRETWLPWFSEGIEEQLRARLQNVGDVQVRLVHEPKWTPQQMSDRARRTIGPTDE